MAELSGFLKLVVRLSTTRTEGQIRTRLNSLEAAYKAQLQALIDSDPQTSLVKWKYRLKVDRHPTADVAAVYPKLSWTLNTSRTVEQILGALEPLYDDLKQDIRDLAAGDPHTTITSWHVHRASGHADEAE